MRLLDQMHISLLTTATVVAAWDFGFVHAAQELLSGLNGHHHGHQQIVHTPTKKIAIIGAGAAGSSSAFWIKKAKERHGLDVEVHVFDKVGACSFRVVHVAHCMTSYPLQSDYIGGSK